MNDREPAPAQHLSIAAVERDTGLSKDTLRVWERRYGFPRPDRDAAGDRLYPPDQVERLRVIRRLIDAGHRPRRVVALEPEALHALSAPAAVAVRLVDFVTLVVAPLNTAVGDAWMQGRFQVFEEHLYTECVTGVLRNAIASIPAPQGNGAPRVLLTSFPDEPHGLGLLMAEALFALEGCNCLPLGPQTPIADIAKAAQAYRADIVALSFTALLGANAVVSGLQELRRQLPPAVAIWVGGSNPALSRRELPGVLQVQALESLREQVTRWRSQSTDAQADQGKV